MADQASSFIPKNSNRVERKVRTTKRIYLLSYVSYIVFFGTLLLVVGVYLYGAQVESELASVKEQVNEARSRFAPAETIEEIKMLDRQLTLSRQMINSSAAPSRIFSEIENVTAQNMQFTGLTYEYLPNRQFQLTLNGLADDFNEVLYQAELMKQSSLLGDGYVMGYDYSLGQGEGSTTGAPAGSATLTFVFTDTSDISAIPYVPEAQAVPPVETSNEEGNQVLNVTASEEGDGGDEEEVSAEADSSEEATVTVTPSSNEEDAGSGVTN